MKKANLIIGIIIIVLVLAVVGYLAVSMGLPLLMLAHEDEVLRAQLDNPYVDADFPEWEQYNIEGIGSFLLPGEWNISEESESYQIVDNEDNVIAAAALWNSDKNDDSISFLENLSYVNIEDVHFERSYHMDGSCFGVICINDGMREQELYFLSLEKYMGDVFVVIFQPENDAVTDELLEAILFSYTMTEP